MLQCKKLNLALWRMVILIEAVRQVCVFNTCEGKRAKKKLSYIKKATINKNKMEKEEAKSTK